MSTPAGWYVDPERKGQLRYWDGKAWTDHRAPAPSPNASGLRSAVNATPPRPLGKQQPKRAGKGWVKRHPIWMGVLAVVALFLLVGMLAPDDSQQPKGTEAPAAAQAQQDEPLADTQAPTSSVSFPEGWTRGPVTIELSVEDDSCSPEECTIYYSTDGGETWEAGTSVTVKEQGKQTVLVYAEDASGNKEDVGYCRLFIDNGRPETHVLNSPSVDKGDYVTLKYRIEDRTPRVTAYLRLTGPQGKTIRLGSEPTGKVRQFRLKANLATGTYTWAVYAKDQAGNKATKRVSGQLIVKAKPAPSSSGGSTIWVGITESGECYHRLTCYQWTKDPEGNSKVTLSQAKAMGYRPCSLCDPPY